MVGLRVVGVRRTPGLRREEPATLADISADYCLRLEQGRQARPSGDMRSPIIGGTHRPARQRWTQPPEAAAIAGDRHPTCGGVAGGEVTGEQAENPVGSASQHKIR